MTKTDIANIALRTIGVGRIDSIDDSDDTSTSCRETIDRAVNDYAQAVVTNAMLVRQALVVAGTPVDAWSYAYALPTTPPVLRPVRLASGSPYYREGGILHTNDPAAVLVYIKGGVDVADLPDHAAEAIGFRLAVLLASDQGKDERLDKAFQLYSQAIAKAKDIEGRYNTPQTRSRLWGTPQ